MIDLHLGDCLDVLPRLDANSVDLVVTDPPYYKVKGEPWDRQWDTAAGYLAWLDRVLAEFARALKPNGSLYLFASPKMAARVECLVGERFNVVNRITWRKPPFSTKAEMFRKGDLRSYFPASEAIIFAEHPNADNAAKGESGYGAKCDELRGFVFEPLRAYLDSERVRAGVTQRQVIAHLGMTGHDPHFFKRVQWKLPLAYQYAVLRVLFNEHGNGSGPYLRREYEDLRREYEDLRREYEDLRREYEDLRRPFSVSADVPYTDVWDFPTVQAYPGKHPCEKPLAMMEHIIRASSREGAVVLDAFMGSGVAGEAARKLGRSFVGIEQSEHWYAMATARIRREPRREIEQLPLEIPTCA